MKYSQKSFELHFSSALHLNEALWEILYSWLENFLQKHRVRKESLNWRRRGKEFSATEGDIYFVGCLSFHWRRQKQFHFHFQRHDSKENSQQLLGFGIWNIFPLCVDITWQLPREKLFVLCAPPATNHIMCLCPTLINWATLLKENCDLRVAFFIKYF